MTNIVESFKTLPGPTKGLMAAGTLMGLLVALPLFVYAVLGGNFEIRNKAASGEPITGEPIPTPTIPALTPTPTVLLPDPTSVPTPTPVSCIRSPQTVTLSPVSQAGLPGQSLTYSINITNNDSETCPVSTLTFNAILPFSNWTAVVPPAVTSTPGSHGTALIVIKSSVNTPQGSVPVGVSVSGPSGVVSASATYTIGVTPSPTPSSPTALIQNGSFETNLDADRIPDTWSWGKTAVPAKDEGIDCGPNHIDGNCSLAVSGGIFQKVVKQQINFPSVGKNIFVFDAWSKSVGATGPGAYRIEIEFLNSAGKVVQRKTYNFKRGTHDFARIGKNEITFKINREFRSITLNVIYNKPFGKVWFDNITLKSLSPTLYDSIRETPEEPQETVLQFVQNLF